MASTFEHTLERLDAARSHRSMTMGVSLVETVVQSRSQTEERLGRARRRGTRGAREDDPVGQPDVRRAHGGRAGRAPMAPTRRSRTLRAVKELQAGLGADVLGAVDRRFQTMSRATPQGDPVHRRGHGQGGGGPGGEDRSPFCPRRRRGRRGSSDRDRSDERCDPGDVRSRPCASDGAASPTEANRRLAFADRVFGDAVTFERDPELERRRSCRWVETCHPTDGDDLLSHEYGGAELSRQPNDAARDRRPTPRRTPQGDPW